MIIPMESLIIIVIVNIVQIKYFNFCTVSFDVKSYFYRYLLKVIIRASIH